MREREIERWTLVSSRKMRGTRRDQNKTDRINLHNTESDGTTTCYINNLPKDITEREIKRMFERWGKVVDVYIARKRNKLGKIFGFVRYVDIKDDKWLEDQLKDVWFGSYKVWANISRFQRKNSRLVQWRRSSKEEYRTLVRKDGWVREKQNTQNVGVWHNMRKNGKTYADATRNKESTFREKHHGNVTKEGTSLFISIKEEEMTWAKSGFTGFVRKVEDLSSLQQRFENEGIATIKAIPMGGERVFIKVDEDEDFKSLVKEYEGFFQQEFSIIREWNPRDIGGARYVWVRAWGIPIHAWNKKVFSLLTTSFGKLMKLDQATIDRERFDLARLYVRTTMMEFINKVIKVQINDEIFAIRITEELCDCESGDYMMDIENYLSDAEVEDDDTSVNSMDTCIPPSMSSEEDEETMKKIEDNAEHLILEAAAAEALNGGIHAVDNTENEKNEGPNPPELTQILNETCRIFNACGDLSGIKLKTKETVGGIVSCSNDKNSGDLIRWGPSIEREKNGPLHEPSPIQSSGEIQVTDKIDNYSNSGGTQIKTKAPKENPNQACQEDKGNQNRLEQPRHDPLQSLNSKASMEIIKNYGNLGDDDENKESDRVDIGKKASSRQEGKSPDNVSQGTSISSKVRRKRRIEILREKKKLKKKGKKVSTNCSCSQRSRLHKVQANHNSVLTENESDRKMWVLLHGDAKEVAKDVWDLGKDYGLLHKGEEGEIIQELVSGVKIGEGSSK
ncbi:uncharacterized protein LOC131661586 isoform X1 [Vicia villosa]|uniref:uncharacterized protein LOC131661586 isoform X1 n=1 Tax=Vicia villosa TaxID=3911 RepID=UPI00273BC89F|nr:uncharacterized protein LOC131661586 isoform X1 [Vicia villosa]XP_058787159.1 uncharacterized protein LOC131661586 isoform X1 [Vicia villosa]XP_058787160.1 uncharacterized protein LOC131661586 isoform X1 [Vicia villosa]XP_058787161.1 uncharacterized protein LOC131661586 isoform X1 [Vicia villosa]